MARERIDDRRPEGRRGRLASSHRRHFVAPKESPGDILVRHAVEIEEQREEDARRLDGVQLGLVNIIREGGQFPIFPIVSWGSGD